MAMNDVECCDFYQVHEDVVRAVNDKMPDEDKLCLLYTSHDGQELELLGTRWKVLFTPGHTAGSCLSLIHISSAMLRLPGKGSPP